MKLKFHKTVGKWNAGETHEVSTQDAAWLQVKGLASPVTDEIDELFKEEKPIEKPKVKVTPANKAQKAPENK